MARLPHADWTGRDDLAELVRAIGAQDMRWVGGAVRDTMLGLEVKDIDAATTHRPEEVMERLKSAGIRAIPTGLQHGTVTAVCAEGPVEITTLRQDLETDGRHADVVFSRDWREDAARRDFTINALYAHPETLEISDYFGGLEDLEAGRVRFIGDAAKRIREDHLRILRYFRFQARFGSTLDEDGERACAQLAPMLKGLSRERVGWELQNLLALPNPIATVRRMHDRGVLPVVLPEVDTAGLDRLEQLIAAEDRHDIAPAAVRRIAALLPPDGKVAETVASRLRMSNALKKRLVTASRRAAQQDLTEPRALAYWLGREEATDVLLLTGGDASDISGWTIPELPLKGGQIVASGVAAGPEVARILQAVEARWVAEGFPDESRVQRLLEEELG